MAEEDEPIDACDAPLLELHIQISSIWNDRKRLQAENKRLKELLAYAVDTLKAQTIIAEQIEQSELWMKCQKKN